MDRLEILSKVKKLADEWKGKTSFNVDFEAMMYIEAAASDLLELQQEIENSLDEEAEGLLKQEQEKKE